ARERIRRPVVRVHPLDPRRRPLPPHAKRHRQRLHRRPLDLLPRTPAQHRRRRTSHPPGYHRHTQRPRRPPRRERRARHVHERQILHPLIRARAPRHVRSLPERLAHTHHHLHHRPRRQLPRRTPRRRDLRHKPHRSRRIRSHLQHAQRQRHHDACRM